MKLNMNSVASSTNGSNSGDKTQTWTRTKGNKRNSLLFYHSHDDESPHQKTVTPPATLFCTTETAPKTMSQAKLQLPWLKFRRVRPVLDQLSIVSHAILWQVSKREPFREALNKREDLFLFFFISWHDEWCFNQPLALHRFCKTLLCPVKRHCQVDNVQVFMSHNSAEFHWTFYFLILFLYSKTLKTTSARVKFEAAVLFLFANFDGLTFWQLWFCSTNKMIWTILTRIVIG